MLDAEQEKLRCKNEGVVAVFIPPVTLKGTPFHNTSLFLFAAAKIDSQTPMTEPRSPWSLWSRVKWRWKKLHKTETPICKPEWWNFGGWHPVKAGGPSTSPDVLRFGRVAGLAKMRWIVPPGCGVAPSSSRLQRRGRFRLLCRHGKEDY
ncbi:hypothetical protein CKAH01_09151 [Colletotrichum kahawae]|uniref:Uncharacterized protein n=1 Tax=Colletotrichum kahawae TaxID=34407 RepID=A0AAD9XZ85_COLKA|nr:hypothetical protein CKAH01_09151 [Colletotrichum kahawae]